MSMPKVSIIVPAYNEENVIGRVISELKDLNNDYEIIVVDDASTDNTYNLACQEVTPDSTREDAVNVAQGFSPASKVIRHPYNKGYGASLKTGIKNASGEIICFFDGDGQHRGEDLKEVIKYIGETRSARKRVEYDAVFGMRTSESHVPFLRKPGKKFLSWVANYLSSHKIPDLNCGLRAIKREMLIKILHILPDGFSFSTTTTLAAYKLGYNIKWVPVTTLPRTGKSTVGIRHGMQTLLLIVRMISLFDPLRVFFPIAILLSLGGLASLINDFAFGRGNIADASILLLLSGLLIFFFGILAEQISALRREGKM
ncbi:glycosyltransferase family 2 protein [candidate division WOR-3 bacterium]|nr:glycosyltransferase family 2 protein [candidate division WOR-3 bacterium]